MTILPLKMTEEHQKRMTCRCHLFTDSRTKCAVLQQINLMNLKKQKKTIKYNTKT